MVSPVGPLTNRGGIRGLAQRSHAPSRVSSAFCSPHGFSRKIVFDCRQHRPTSNCSRSPGYVHEQQHFPTNDKCMPTRAFLRTSPPLSPNGKNMGVGFRRGWGCRRSALDSTKITTDSFMRWHTTLSTLEKQAFLRGMMKALERELSKSQLSNGHATTPES